MLQVLPWWRHPQLVRDVEILIDQGLETNLDLLERLWSRPETFALVPTKTGVTRDWLNEALGKLPPHLIIGHFCLLTSGSTGTPKLVVGCKTRATKLAQVLHSAQASGAVEQAILALPLAYCYAFVNQWVWSRVFEKRLILGGGFSKPDVLLSALHRAGAAMLCLVGPQAPLVLQMFAGETFPGIIRLHFAGGRFPQEHIVALQQMFPSARIFNNYGCAEAMPRLTVRAAEDGTDARDIGAPLPGVELMARENSELLFRSSYRAVAQLDAHSCREFPDELWIPTGDVGRVRPDGQWQLLGRASEVFKRYGEKIALPQILTTITEHWSGEAGAYRERDGAGEDGYVLVVSPSPTAADLTALLRALRANHPRTHWPLRIESLPSMPKLSNGKIDNITLATKAGTSLEWRQRI